MYVSIYRRPAKVKQLGQKIENAFVEPSALHIVNMADNYQELFLTVKSFSEGKVEVYDVTSGLKVGTLFPTGRISIRSEYLGA